MSGASQSENCTGRGLRWNVRMPCGASQTRSHPAGQIDGHIGPASVERLTELAEVPQAPHVEGDVKQPRHERTRGQQAPPFARERNQA